MDEIDIWRIANIVLKLHGEAGPEFASRRIGELTVAGDGARAAVWNRVLAAMAVLRMGKAPEDGPRH